MRCLQKAWCLCNSTAVAGAAGQLGVLHHTDMLLELLVSSGCYTTLTCCWSCWSAQGATLHWHVAGVLVSSGCYTTLTRCWSAGQLGVLCYTDMLLELLVSSGCYTALTRLKQQYVIPPWHLFDDFSCVSLLHTPSATKETEQSQWLLHLTTEWEDSEEGTCSSYMGTYRGTMWPAANQPVSQPFNCKVSVCVFTILQVCIKCSITRHYFTPNYKQYKRVQVFCSWSVWNDLEHFVKVKHFSCTCLPDSSYTQIRLYKVYSFYKWVKGPG